MASSEQLFLALLRDESIQDRLLPLLDAASLCALRQSSSACCNLLTKRLFTRLHVTFTAATFTKPCRVAALARVGHHVEHLTFHLAHSAATFLPPLLDPRTGAELAFLYTPHTSMHAALTRPKYASPDLADALTRQYPPLFHAATNVPSFIHALARMPALRHLTVRCPGQHPAERYRRDVVDYALISLRIAVERAPLTSLRTLSLSQLHPAALAYLRHVNGIGSVPSAGRRWRQIRSLRMSVEAWDFGAGGGGGGGGGGLDHLKIIDDYIRALAPHLEKLSFSWIGGGRPGAADRGPCPLALADDPLFAPPSSSSSPASARKLFHEVTSPMSPLPPLPASAAARPPIHMPALRYLQIRNAAMNAAQLRRLIAAHRATVREFDLDNVALAERDRWDDALAPVSEGRQWSRSGGGPVGSRCSLVSSDDADDLLRSPSAAVEAVARELLEMDVGAYGFDDDERTVMDELTEEAASPAERERSGGGGGGFTARIRKKKRSHRHGDRDEDHHRSRRKHGRNASEPDRKATTPPPSLPRSGSSSSSSSSPFSSFPFPLRRRRPSQTTSWPPPSSSSSARAPRPPPLPLPDPSISPPILSASPQPVLLLLQPTVYDPHAAAGGGGADEGITPVQRDLEREEARRLLAEDAAARVSALRRAKEAVMTKLTREFSKRQQQHGRRSGGGGGGGDDGHGAVAACRVMAGRDLGAGCGSYYTGNSDFVLEDGRGMGSPTAMHVPLMFSRA